MTDYQRACEVVGCHEHYDGTALFAVKAEEWLMQGLGSICLLKSGSNYAVIVNGLTHRADTLTAALTAAVLAVAGENDGP